MSLKKSKNSLFNKISKVYNLANDAKDYTVKKITDHPSAMKMLAVAPLAYVGLRAIGGAVAEVNSTIGDDLLGLRDALISFIEPNLTSSDLSVYGVDSAGELIQMSYGVNDTEKGLDVLLRDYQTDQFSEYVIFAGEEGHSITDAQLLAENSTYSIGSEVKTTPTDDTYCGSAAVGYISTAIVASLATLFASAKLHQRANKKSKK